MASLLDRIADISHRAPAAADDFRRVDRHFDADRDVHHGCGAVVRQRPRFSVAARQPRPAPLARTEGALGPVSAGWGARPALCPHVAGRAGLLCDGPAPTAYADQHLERSANHSIRDRPGRLFADLSRSGHAAGATAAARGARHPFVSGARDSGTGEPALDRCGRSDPLPVPRPCPRHSSSMWSIRL